MKEPKFSIAFISLLVLIYGGTCEAQVPDQASAPTIASVSSTAIEINFENVTGATTYIVTASPKHGAKSAIVTVSNTASASITNLNPSTLYDISVQGNSSIGNVGVPGNVTSQQTHPAAPTLSFSSPLPTSVFVFLNTSNRARISQWTLEYRESGSSDATTVTTPSSRFYVLRLSNLSSYTTYEIRARASQLVDGTNLTNTDFSIWYNFTTDSLSVFGRVTLTGENFTNTSEYSAEWNSTLVTLQRAYENLTSLNSINIVRMDNGTGIVHYQIKIKNKTFEGLSNNTFLLTGSQFQDPAVNIGDRGRGDAVITYDSTITGVRGWDMSYVKGNGTATSGGITDTYMLISPEGASTIPRNILPSAGGSEGDSFTRIRSFVFTDKTASYPNVNSVTIYLSNLILNAFNAVIGFEPRYLIRDFLRNQSTELLYSIYHTEDITPRGQPVFLRTTGINRADLPALTYVSSSDGTSVTLSIPSIDKFIQYSVTGSGVNVTLSESDIDGSGILKMPMGSLNNGTTYNLTLEVTRRKHDGFTDRESTSFSITPDSNQCSSCSVNASCETSVTTGSVTCTCNEGFEGNGTVCVPITTTTFLPAAGSTAATTTMDIPTTPTVAPTTPETTTADIPTTPTVAPTTPGSTTADIPTTPTVAPTTLETTAADILTTSTAAPTTPDTTTADIPTTPTVAPTTPETTTADIPTTPTVAPTTPETTTADIPTASTAATTTPETTTADIPTTPTVAPTTTGTTTADIPTTPTVAPTTPGTTTADIPTASTAATTTPETTTADIPTTPTVAPTTPGTTTADIPSTPTVAPTTTGTTAADIPTTFTAAPTTPETTTDDIPTTPTVAPTTPGTTTADIPTTPTVAPTTPGTTTAEITTTTTAEPTPPPLTTTTVSPTTITTTSTTPGTTATDSPTTVTATPGPTTVTSTIVASTDPDPTAMDSSTATNATSATSDTTTTDRSTTTDSPTATTLVSTTPDTIAPDSSTTATATFTTMTMITTEGITAPTPAFTVSTTSDRTPLPPTTTMDTVTSTPSVCILESSANATFIPQRLDLSHASFNVIWNNVSVVGYVVTAECAGCPEPVSYNTTSVAEINLIHLLPGRTYNVCVTAGLCFSGIIQNSTQCSPLVKNPSSVGNINFIIGTNSVTISWNAVEGASSYLIITTRVTSARRRRKRAWTSRERRITGTSVTYTDLEPCTNYSVDVTAENSGGSSEPATKSFTTSGCPTPVSTACPTCTTTGTSTPSSTGTTPATRAITTQTSIDTTTASSASKPTPTSSSTLSASTPTSTVTETTSNATETSSTSPAPTNTTSRPTIQTTSGGSTLTPTKLSSTFRSTTGTSFSPSSAATSDSSSTETSASTNSTASMTVSTTPPPTPPPPPPGVPWWFIFSIVLAIVIIIACIVLIVNRRKIQKTPV